jgi:hypothetical protein
MRDPLVDGFALACLASILAIIALAIWQYKP